MLGDPSGAARPAARVPRMPIVATGVRTAIASGPVMAISPERKLNTPSTTENTEAPVPASGSKTKASRTMRASAPCAKVESSTKTMPITEATPVSTVSPSTTGTPSSKITRVPSALIASASPATVSTTPMGCASRDSAAAAPAQPAMTTTNAEARSALRTD